MLSPLRGLLTLVAIAGLPVAAAQCPTVDDVDRYMQTTKTALDAVAGFAPPSQQQLMTDRYTATVMLKWDLVGVESLTGDRAALDQLAQCYSASACGLRDEEARILTPLLTYLSASNLSGLSLPDTLPVQPPVSATNWAKLALDCLDPSEIEALEQEAERTDAETEEPVSEPAQEELEAPATILAEATPQPAAPVIRVQSVSVSSSSLFATAAALVRSGEREAALPSLREACIADARTQPRSEACNAIFGLYTTGLAGIEGEPETGRLRPSVTAYLDLSEELCGMSFRQGCLNISEHYREISTGEGRRLTVYYTDRACDLGDGEACALSASYYVIGRSGEPNMASGRARLEQACELGNHRSCREVAKFYLRGIGGDRNLDKAFEATAASCPAVGATDPDICVSAADFMLINGMGRASNDRDIRAYLKRACDLGHGVGCSWYAEDLELGQGGEVDLAAAKQARLVACQHGDDESCETSDY